MIQIAAVVEGISDEGAVRSILMECGFAPTMFHGRKGRSDVLKKLVAYNEAARFSPWFVLVDLDSEPCAVAAARDWLSSPSDFMVFRVAVSELEAWLLADRQEMSSFLGISESKIPRNPDELPDPKQAIVNLARKSRKRDIREGLVPRPGSGTSIGPTYVSDIREFGRTQWRPRVAAEESPSLARCLMRLDDLRQRLQG